MYSIDNNRLANKKSILSNTDDGDSGLPASARIEQGT